MTGQREAWSAVTGRPSRHPRRIPCRRLPQSGEHQTMMRWQDHEQRSPGGMGGASLAPHGLAPHGVQDAGVPPRGHRGDWLARPRGHGHRLPWPGAHGLDSENPGPAETAPTGRGGALPTGSSTSASVSPQVSEPSRSSRQASRRAAGKQAGQSPRSPAASRRWSTAPLAPIGVKRLKSQSPQALASAGRRPASHPLPSGVGRGEGLLFSELES